MHTPPTYAPNLDDHHRETFVPQLVEWVPSNTNSGDSVGGGGGDSGAGDGDVSLVGGGASGAGDGISAANALQLQLHDLDTIVQRQPICISVCAINAAGKMVPPSALSKPDQDLFWELYGRLCTPHNGPGSAARCSFLNMILDLRLLEATVSHC
jgi:hypothetical protein